MPEQPAEHEVRQLTYRAADALVDPAWLDAVVHDTAADIASAVNDGGFYEQITYLIEHGHNAAQLVSTIDRFAAERAAGKEPW